ncbi:MAG: hypothetical protein AB1725_04030 [Armatimonadota bacterium]
MNYHLLRSVADAIEEVRAMRDRTSGRWSEADTETRAIEPVLHALGYKQWEYSKRPASTGGYFPDYVILPTGKHMWVLEAKAWGESLETKADQAVNYANNDGSEWAVITNGKRWILYEATRKAPIHDKVVEAIDILDDPGAAERLTTLLSKDAMIANEPRKVARAAWLRRVLESELRNPSSNLVSVLCEHVNAEHEMSVSEQDIAEALCMLLTPSSPVQPPSSPAPPRHERPMHAAPSGSSSPLSRAPELPKGEVTLRELQSIAVTHMQAPREVVLPGGRRLSCQRWKDLLVKLAEELCSTGRLTAPVTAPGARRVIINWEPVNQHGRPMHVPKQISIGSRTAYIETNYSAGDIVKQVGLLVDLAGISPDAVIIRW